jgi:hypothetical protein
MQSPPSQHSPSMLQDRPTAWHWHVWSSPQSIQPQQSRCPEQRSPGLRQQRSVVGEGTQSALSQQSAGVVHASLGSPPQALEQNRKSHSSSPSHVSAGSSPPLVSKQQSWPSRPHSIPRMSAMVPIPTHRFVMKGSQMAPNSQLSPGQQGWPSAPHVDPASPGPGAAMHIRDVVSHVAPRTQSLGVPDPVSQQGSPAEPHPLGVSQVPRMHRREPAEPHGVEPSQQGLPDPPQLSHVLRTQTPPARHTSPVQHVPPDAPQPSAGSVHVPSMHARPSRQSLDPMHPAPSGTRQSRSAPLPSHTSPPAQSVAVVQDPPGRLRQVLSPESQVRPRLHAPLRQQRSPRLPQGSVEPPGGTEPSSATTRPSGSRRMPVSRRELVPPSTPASGSSPPQLAQPPRVGAARKTSRVEAKPRIRMALMIARAALCLERFQGVALGAGRKTRRHKG